MPAEDEPGHRAALTRRDLMFFERRLRDTAAALFSFKSHSLHFPRTREECAPVWLEREKKLLLPLPDAEGGCLGVFTAGGVNKSPARLLPLWPALSSLVRDNLLLYKRSITDPVTGLFTRHYLLRCLERELETLRDPARLSPTADAADPQGEQIRGAKEEAERRDPPEAAPDALPGARPPADVRAGTRRDDGAPARFSTGILVVRLAALRDVVREYGYAFADDLMTALADCLTATCPEQALAARTGDSEFAVLLPAASPAACRGLSAALVRAMRLVALPHPKLREQIGIDLSIGYAVYPQDMAGDVFALPAAEQARIVLRKARLASALAGEHTSSHPGRADPEGVTGFGRILAEGGRVLECLPMSAIIISLGANAHAAEGQRFSVWSARFPGGDAHGRPRSPLYKGEAAIMEVYEDVSRAEVIHLGEPTWDIEPGDLLLLLPDEQGSRAGSGSRGPDPETGLLRHGEFLARWAEERDRASSFALTLLRLAPKNSAAAHNSPDDGAPDDPATETAHAGFPLIHPEACMAEAARICRERFGPEAVGGRYSLNSLIFYHPFRDGDRSARSGAAANGTPPRPSGTDAGGAPLPHSGADRASLTPETGPDTSAQSPEARLNALVARCAEAVTEIERRLNLDAAAGIAPHPYLEFRKADALENSRKALEYALLLPEPHVGLLDSQALNISADKRFIRGDTFGAVREYQAALLADENNGTAWNSLGVCLAGLSRHAEAETYFARALECKPSDAMVLYNLGYMHQSAGRADEARRCFQECLNADPGHLFALIRLGRLAESAGDAAGAGEFYSRAARLPGGESPTRRHFARLCIAEGKTDEAREHLHEALIYDPGDAAAMALLAGLFLDAGEDPEIALSLARSSVSLRPDLKSARAQLARALEAAGNGKETRKR
ncbi:MAG: diguanylate cyclase [Desulfovibrio sp.]|jgi:tetratricopeptide (TPR) repeat protein/GGDEF domain-containing protein|nr:diguanylate cyclase [Desulfovibrio sp.]